MTDDTITLAERIAERLEREANVYTNISRKEEAAAIRIVIEGYRRYEALKAEIADLVTDEGYQAVLHVAADEGEDDEPPCVYVAQFEDDGTYPIMHSAACRTPGEAVDHLADQCIERLKGAGM